MRRLETVLEVRKCLHEFPRALARHGTLFMSRAEIADDTSECALYRAHCLEREVRGRMSDSIHRVSDFFAHKCSEVDMRENIFYTLDV